MINIVIPMAGISPLADELGYPYPSPLVEIHSKPLIQHVINNLSEIGDDITITAILREDDCKRFHLDSTIRLLTDGSANIVKLQRDTAGALCSVLMAIEFFANDSPLIIANSDQVYDEGVLASMLEKIRAIDPDAACPTFESVHPRWSYLQIENARVVEAIEKKPVSRNAVAGLYYFKTGKQFAHFAMRSILNGRETDGRYFTSAVLNEYILDGLAIIPIGIDDNSYHSLFTAQRVVEFEHRARNA